MSYEVFRRKVNALIERAGGNIVVRFYSDADKGRHCARFSDGTTIMGNSSSSKVSVRWNGGNHQGMVAI